MNQKKHESPYDPNYQGKSKRPQTPTEQNQTRGCGNPDCASCNPLTASITGRPPGNPLSLSSRTIGEILRDMDYPGSMFAEFMVTNNQSTPTGQPSASYVAARKAVQSYLSTAPDQDFTDIVGNEEALEQLKNAIRAPVENKELYLAYGMKMPKGALLSGPPGCGKTMFARAAASEMQCLYETDEKGFEFISLSGSELHTMYVGETEKKIKALFTFAREYKAWHGHPLLIFIDEAEVILPDRTGRIRRVAPWEESQVATFLAEMDGMQESGAFVMLATNRPEVIDQAVLRDGRCDFKIVVKKPTIEAVEIIVRKNFEGAFMKDSIEDLVFAAVESLHDPHKIIVEFHALGFNYEATELKDAVKDVAQKHFLLEHLVSGAMAASIPNRAKRYAFTRDKKSGKAEGVTVDDVVQSVNDLWIENRGLEHSFALDEFRKEFMDEVQARQKRKTH